MPDAGRKAPQVAYAEDYDDHHDQINPQSRIHARVDRSPTVKFASKSDSSNTRDAASDSGYSSVHSGPTAYLNASESTLTVRPSDRGMGESTRPKTVVAQQNGILKTKEKATPSRSRSQAKPCDDPNCGDPKCTSRRNNADRRFVLPHHPAATTPHATRPTAQSVGQYNAPVQSSAMMMPNPYMQVPPELDTQARRLSASGRARPVSFHGYASAPGYVFQQQPHGPPPSPSAYHHQVPGYLPMPPPSTAPPAFALQAYGAARPVMHNMLPPPPTTPYNTGDANQNYAEYSARQVSKDYSGFEAKARPSSIRASSQKPATARRSTRRKSRQDYSGSGSSDCSDSEGDCSCSDRECRRKKNARDRRLMPPPAIRRPAIQERHTEPLTSHSNIARQRRQSRDLSAEVSPPPREYVEAEQLVRTRSDRPRHRLSREIAYVSEDEDLEDERHARMRSDRPVMTRPIQRLSRELDFDYASAGEYLETERGGRGRNVRSVDPAFAARTRRQTVDDGYAVKDPRQTTANHRNSTSFAEAYQRRVNGGELEDLTAERIHQQANTSSHRSANSRVSRKSSIRSTQSKTDGIRIQNGDTVLHVYGDATIEMQGGEEGEPASLIINSSNAREGTQQGSVYSSGSRTLYRRSRDIKPIHDEDGYERAL